MPNLHESTGLRDERCQANQPARAGEAQETILVYRRVLQNNPDDVAVLKDLGMLYSEIGQVGNAIECFSKAAKLDPDNQDLQNKLESALQELHAKPKLEWAM